MRIRDLLIMALGVALAGGGVFYALEPREIIFPGFQTAPATVRVLAAKRTLARGTPLTAEDLQWVDWPKSTVPEGHFTSVDALLGKDGALWRVVVRGIDAGAPIIADSVGQLGDPHPGPGVLSPGMRAVSVRIDPIDSVSGFVAAGDWVDVMLTRLLEGNITSTVIIQDVAVLYISQAVEPGPIPPRPGPTVTLAVTSNQAQKLALAHRVGRLSVVLRATGERPTNPDTDGLYPDRAMPPGLRRWDGSISDFPIDPDIFPEFIAPRN